VHASACLKDVSPCLILPQKCSSSLLTKLFGEIFKHLQVLDGHCWPCSEQHLLKVTHGDAWWLHLHTCKKNVLLSHTSPGKTISMSGVLDCGLAPHPADHLCGETLSKSAITSVYTELYPWRSCLRSSCMREMRARRSPVGQAPSLLAVSGLLPLSLSRWEHRAHTLAAHQAPLFAYNARHKIKSLLSTNLQT